jgi:hypothetical protein
MLVHGSPRRAATVYDWPRHTTLHPRGSRTLILMELNGWSSPQMLRRYGASARSARARRSYDRVMEGKS